MLAIARHRVCSHLPISVSKASAFLNVRALLTRGLRVSYCPTMAIHSLPDRSFQYFDQVPEIPLDAGFKLNARCKQDAFAQKVDLGLGAYRDDKGKPWVLPVVRKVEQAMANDDSFDHEYLSMDGLPAFREAALNLLLGDQHPYIASGQARCVQTISGTGALRTGAEFLGRFMGNNTMAYVSDPTWNNHPQIFQDAGMRCTTYRYWDSAKKRLDLDGMLQDLHNASDQSVIVLHACAHNPTGMDPTRQQWDQIFDVVQAKRHFVFFDLAYQGFASGDPDGDAWAVRHFIEKGQDVFVAQSFAKNFGLYSERAGCVSVVFKNHMITANIISQMNRIVRAMWSNPPAHGAHIVARVINNKLLRSEWLDCLKVMSGRIQSMRKALYDGLVFKQTPGHWDHIVKQIGMFAYSGLTEEQVKILVEKYHIYLYANGRMSVAGLNSSNVEYVVNAIHDAVTITTAKSGA